MVANDITSDAEKQLHALSLAANQHAQDRHAVIIATDDAASIEVVDQIIDRERSVRDPEFVESLTLCYGAWLGEYLRRHCGAQWTGLEEPTPPMIRFDGVDHGPMGAVNRRLANDSAPPLGSLARNLISASTTVATKTGSTETGNRESESTAAKNRDAWDAKSRDPRFTFSGNLPESRQQALAAVDPWLRAEGELQGRSVLCLAAGGGTHGPLHVLAGADVTVVDFSPKQLQYDRKIADDLGIALITIEASMDNLSSISDESFDAVIHPVSLCYVKHIEPVYREISRVLKPGGLYISQQKQPASLQASAFEDSSSSLFANRNAGGYVLEHPNVDGLPLPAMAGQVSWRESGTQEFVHPVQALLGGLCDTGFLIEAITEPPRGDAWAPEGTAEHRARFLPPYIRIKARRR